MPDERTEPENLETFAAGLRELKERAGDPKLLAIVEESGISKTVLSDAFSGRRLPTERTVAAIATSLGGDRAEWVRRRRELAARIAQSDGVEGDSIGGEEVVSADAVDAALQDEKGFTAPRKQVSLRAALGMCAVAAIVGSGATIAVGALIPRDAPPAAAAAVGGDPASDSEAVDSGPFVEFADGVDPMQTVCRTDAVIGGSAERLDGEVQVQMMYSSRCMAAWGRVTRYDGKETGNSVSIRIFPKDDPQSDRSQERSAADVQSLYTTLMIEPDVDARVCGVATVTRDGESIELGPPLCI